jgi:AcrR family transcriptional regulator
MTGSVNNKEINGLSATRDRLVAAGRARIAAAGLAEASARSIARLADVNPSAINYNLGGIEHLYELIFAQAAEDTAPWLAAWIKDTENLPADAAGACAALEYVIHAWTSRARDLALLYQEALSWAAADPAMLARWTRQWWDFWLAMALRCGLDEMQGRVMNLFFQSEALYHLSPWSPAAETAALRDLCDHFGWIWLGAPRRAASGGLEHIQGLLHGQNLVKLAPAALKLALSAVAVVQDKGLLGLTHRAVAAHAGVTVGAVTHYFRTAEDLVAGAIRGQVEALFQVEDADSATALERGAVPSLAGLADGIAQSVDSPAVARVLFARRSLFLASLRSADSARAGAVVRFGYGRTSERILAPIIRIDRDAIPLHAAVMSRLVSSLWIAGLAGDNGLGQLGREVIARLDR